jgi:hypothetical protein
MVQTFQYFSKRTADLLRERAGESSALQPYSYKAAKLRDGSEEEEQPSVG